MKKCILFAGATGCSKTPVAVYLSFKLNLPIFNNDAIRSEVIEDLKKFDEEEFIRRRDKRIEELVKSGTSFILDASIDRQAGRVKETLRENGYQYFVISFNLSPDFIKKLYHLKGYNESLKRIDEILSDHENFLRENGDIVGLAIDDRSFPDRLKLAIEAARNFINS